MWSANLISVQSAQESADISVVTLEFNHTDGRKIDASERGFTLEQMINYCKQRIDKLETDDKQVQDMKDLIANPPLGLIDTSK